MKLVVTEKPSVARDLAKVLGARTKHEAFFEGDGLRITWALGHLAELEDPAHYDSAWKKWSLDTLPMLPERFQLRLRKGVADQFKAVRQLMRDRQTEVIVNACDAGREGELIFRYVYELAGAEKPVVRLWTSSLTDEALRDAWSRLRPSRDYDALGDAARCRSEADWLVGLNATRALTCHARAHGGGTLLSVGRVQTPTLAMVVIRDRAIEAFVPEPYWMVKAQLVSGPHRWEGTFFQGPAQEAPREDREEDEAPKAERLTSEHAAKEVARLAKGRTGTVTEAERKRIREQPPLLYDLTSLQRRANERYGLSAQRTLAIAQALYEKHKLITYPRTDARFITPDQVAELPKILRGLAGVSVYAPFANALLAGPIKPGKRVVDASEVGDHHAILPTGRTPDGNKLDPDEKKVFDLVARRLMAALSPDAEFDVTTLIVAIPVDRGLPEGVTDPLRFRARGRVCRQEGWRAVDPPGKSREVDLPPVDQGAAATAQDTKVLDGKTRPPRPYTDATLLRAMETAGRELDDAELKRAMRHAGLGTPATRADILQTLLDRKFLERKGRDIRATDMGRALVDAVPVAELKSAELTGRWEARLASVAEGREPRPAFMQAVADHVRGIVTAISSAAPPPAETFAAPETPVLGRCPQCGTPVREGRAAYSCETGRSCSFVVFKTMAKRKISPALVKRLLAVGKTDVVKGFRSKAGKPFEAGLEWKEGKVSFWFAPREGGPSETPAPREGRPAGTPAPREDAPRPRAAPKREEPPAAESPVGLACPACGEGRLLRGRTAWGCDRWRTGCTFVLPFQVSGRMLTDVEAGALLSRGRTELLDGLRDEAGAAIRGRLVWKDGRVSISAR